MSLEIYQTVEVIKKTKNKKIELVKSEIDHLFYIKKTLYQGHFDIYTKLRLLALSGIVPIYEIHEENKSCILIEAYMNVPTLDVFIMNQELTSLQIQQIMEQLWQICSVLHSHGIVHRDIKPENIFYDGQRVTLFDFDIARFVQLHQNQDTQLLGSHGYAAPEQYGFGQSDARTDIYALGVLWNVMLTGQHPSCKLYSGYEGPMIQKAIHVDPMQRYQNVEAMRDDYHHQTDWTWVGFRHGSRMKKGIAGVLYKVYPMSRTIK